ncbi:MAG: hypothetical protein KC586_31045, partial [Myxococcales bacterium]|nr:hypothetical protein [Myxococcales bacterium]
APSPWPLETASLRESLERFTDVTSCVTRLRAGVPVEVAESLADLGYDAVFEDLCRALDAAKKGDPTACGELGATALRDGCQRRVALASGNPDHCPPARGREGRDPICLAWTTGLVGLCDATVGDSRRTCRAVAARDASTCRADARCRAAVQRYADSVADAQSDTLEASLRFTHGVGEHEDERSSDVLSSGVVLDVVGCEYRTRVSVGGPLTEGPQLDLELAFVPGDEGWLVQARALRYADRRVAVPTVASELASEDARFEPRRAGRVEARVRGRLGTEGRLEVHVSTFVRDLDSRPAACPSP